MSPKALLLSIRELETNLWNQIKPESTVYHHCMRGSMGHTRPSSSPPSHQTSRVYFALGKARRRRWCTQAGQLNNARTRRLLSPLSGWGTRPTWKLPSSAAWASPLSESHSEDEAGRSMQSHEINTFSPSISHHSCNKLPCRGGLCSPPGSSYQALLVPAGKTHTHPPTSLLCKSTLGRAEATWEMHTWFCTGAPYTWCGCS